MRRNRRCVTEKIPLQRGALKRLVLGARDDFLLQRRGQIAEVIAIARHAHDQIAMLFGMFLGFAQGFGADDVELDVVALR